MTKIKLYDCFNKWIECDGIWLYSDPHFGDNELKAVIKDRASDEVQIKKINSKVGKKGCFVCLGDVGDIEYVRQIRGYKVLITGNHDVGISNYLRKMDYFSIELKEGFSKSEIRQKVIEKHPEYKDFRIDIYDASPIDIERPDGIINYFIRADNGLFDEVYGGPLMISPKIILSHEPLDINWAFNIHGHNHALEYDRPGHKCVCSDVVLYKPISLAEIIKSGRVNEVTPLHRTTIDRATERKAARSKHE